MTSLQTASLDEIRKAAARICRDYLSGRWKVVTAEQLIVKRISGGLSNFLYYISLPEADTAAGTEHDRLFTISGDKNRNVNDLATCSFSGDIACSGNKRQRTESAASAKNYLLQQMQENEPHEVLLRIYGQAHGEDALEAMITESVVFALLSERNFGPKLHGIFPGGRLEQYIPARALQTIELSQYKISIKIAEKMGEIHSLNIPMSKEPTWLWNCMDRWLKIIDSILNRTDWKHNEAHAQLVKALNFHAETKWLKSVIEQGKYKVLFCHNDLQEGNILYRETDSPACQLTRNALMRSNLEDSAIDEVSVLESLRNANVEDGEGSRRKRSKTSSTINNNQTSPSDFDSTRDSALSITFEASEPELIIIDFEYCAYNYRGFDLANHFLEWTFDYSNPEFPFFFHYKQQYPTKQQRHNFIVAYLKKLNEYIDGYLPSIDEVQAVDDEVRTFSMFSHLFWSLWSVVNTTSNIEFGYWVYALKRISEYKLLKEEYINKQRAKQNAFD